MVMRGRPRHPDGLAFQTTMKTRAIDRHRSFVILTLGGIFGYIAIWQFLAFTLLILMVWLNELVDLGHLLLLLPKRDFSWMRGCLGTGGVLLAASVAIGNTYMQQQQVVRGLLTICSYCHKVRVDSELWQRVETYISKRSSIMFSHGICPSCFVVEKERVVNAAAQLEDG
jgi:hypothetical protein